MFAIGTPPFVAASRNCQSSNRTVSQSANDLNDEML